VFKFKTAILYLNQKVKKQNKISKWQCFQKCKILLLASPAFHLEHRAREGGGETTTNGENLIT
jgi:hypothetical protein